MLLMPQHECNITSRGVTHQSSLRQQERRAQETTSYFQLKIFKMSFKGARPLLHEDDISVEMLI